MKKSIALSILALTMHSACYGAALNHDKRQNEIEHSQAASKAFSSAVSLAKKNDPAGFLKLYEIATDDITSTVEYSEVAYDELSMLLYSNTKLWIKTFSRVNQEKFRKFFVGVNDSQLPNGVSSAEQFSSGIIGNLKSIKGDKKEMELVDYVLGLYGQKRK